MKLDISRLSVAAGTALIALGVASYLASGQASLTALIPVPFGLLLALLGLAARRMSSTRYPMHAAAVVAVIGMAGSFEGLVQAAGLAFGGELGNPLATAAKSVMALVLAAFLGCCIHSFRQARRARQ